MLINVIVYGDYVYFIDVYVGKVNGVFIFSVVNSGIFILEDIKVKFF